jgi:hypothetical protein
MERILARRLPAPHHRLIAAAPELGARRRLVEICRDELAWAREDWLRIAAELGLADDPHPLDGAQAGGAPAWEAARLPHEWAAARLLNVWGHLHPLEHRLDEAVARLRARRAAGWDVAGTLEDVAWYRREGRKLRRAFLAAAADYRRQRAKVGCVDPASGWRRQNASMASNRWRKAS